MGPSTMALWLNTCFACTRILYGCRFVSFHMPFKPIIANKWLYKSPHQSFPQLQSLGSTMSTCWFIPFLLRHSSCGQIALMLCERTTLAAFPLLQGQQFLHESQYLMTWSKLLKLLKIPTSNAITLELEFQYTHVKWKQAFSSQWVLAVSATSRGCGYPDPLTTWGV